MQRHLPANDDPAKSDQAVTDGGGLPADLRAEEAGVAAWFAQMERAEAPAGLRTRVLAGAPAEVKAGRLLRFPLGAWGAASAAVLLLALGAAVTLELRDPLDARAPTPSVASHVSEDLQISEDATLALFHGVEMFDEVGLAPGDVIADWGR